MYWNNVSKKKIIVGIGLVALFILTVSSVNSIRAHDGNDDETQSPGVAKQSNMLQNFTLDSEFKYPTDGPFKYHIYSIVNPEYSPESANQTISTVFGGDVLTDTETFDNYERNAYDYWVPGGLYGIRSDNVLYYFNHAKKPIYDSQEIEKDETLYNSEECIRISEEYIFMRIGQGFDEFMLVDSGVSTVTTMEGEFIKSYRYSYNRIVNGLDVWSGHAGNIHISISPTGEVLSFMLYFPVLEDAGMSELLGPTTAVETVDDNFDNYRPFLYAGYNEYVLTGVHLSYGVVGNELRIGWTFTFGYQENEELTSDLFVA